MPALVEHVDGRSAIVLDDRFLPFVIATWYGEPSESLVSSYFAWVDEHMDRAIADGRKIIVVNDALEVQFPSPRIRAQISRASGRTTHLVAQSVLESYVVLASSVIRSTMTALRWLNPALFFRTVASCNEALRHGIGRLETNGPSGLDPNAYVRPCRPAPKCSASGSALR